MATLRSSSLLAAIALVVAVLACGSRESQQPQSRVHEAEHMPPVTLNPGGGELPIRVAERFDIEVGEFLSTVRIEQNRLEGTGVIYNLFGTGDTLTEEDDADQDLINRVEMLRESRLIPRSITPVRFIDATIAVVKVYGRYPRDKGIGARFDLLIEPLGNATSLTAGFPGAGNPDMEDAPDPPKLACYLFDTHPGSSANDYVAVADDDLSNLEPLEGGRYWRLPNGGQLLHDLPQARTSDETLLLTFHRTNRDLLDGIRRAIEEVYPFQIEVRGTNQIAVFMPPHYPESAEEVAERIPTLTFAHRPRTPLVVLDNRQREIVIVGGPIPMRTRWLATAHVPFKSEDDDDDDVDDEPLVDGDADDESRQAFQRGRIYDQRAMRSVPYILTHPSDDLRDIARNVRADGDDVRLDREDRGGRLSANIAGARGLRIFTWLGGATEPARIYDLPRNDLRLVLAFMRDELQFPPVELKSFLLDAVHSAAFEGFVYERMPRRRFSDDRTVAYLVDTQELVVGTELLPVVVVEGSARNTWDLRPKDGEFSVGLVEVLGPFLGVIEGATFRWRDGDDRGQIRTIRLSESTLREIFEAQIESLHRQFDGNPDMLVSQLRAHGDTLAQSDSDRLTRFAQTFYDEAVRVDATARERIGASQVAVSEDGTFTWVAATGRLLIGDRRLPASIVDVADGTWDLRVNPDVTTYEQASMMIDLLDFLDGASFRWEDAEGVDQHRVIRLSEDALDTLARTHIERIVGEFLPNLDRVAEQLTRYRGILDSFESPRLSALGDLYDEEIERIRNLRRGTDNR